MLFASLDNTIAIAEDIGRQLLVYGRRLSYEEIDERLRAISVGEEARAIAVLPHRPVQFTAQSGCSCHVWLQYVCGGIMSGTPPVFPPKVEEVHRVARQYLWKQEVAVTALGPINDMPTLDEIRRLNSVC